MENQIVLNSPVLVEKTSVNRRFELFPDVSDETGMTGMADQEPHRKCR